MARSFADSSENVIMKEKDRDFSRSKFVAEVVRLRTNNPNSHEFGYDDTHEFGTTEFDIRFG
jgi:hypothetical protein